MAELGNTVIDGSCSVSAAPSNPDDVLRKTEGDALQAAITAATHDAVTVADTQSINFTLTGQQVSGTVIRKTASFSAGEGLISVGSSGLFVSLGSGANQAAAGNHTHANADGSNAGFLSASDYTKLQTVAENASANSADSVLLDRSNHTGQQAASTISDFSTAVAAVALAKTGGSLSGDLTMGGTVNLWARSDLQISEASFSARDFFWKTSSSKPAFFDGSEVQEFATLSEVSSVTYVHPDHTGDVTSSGDGSTTIATGAVTLAKMANANALSILANTGSGSATPAWVNRSDFRAFINVADGATANSSDAALLNRDNHTGQQEASTISDFSTAVGTIALLRDGGGQIDGNLTFTGSESTDYGLALRSITSGQRDALDAGIPNGVMFHNSSTDQFEGKTGDAYVTFLTSGDLSGYLQADGSTAGTGWQELAGLNFKDPVAVTIAGGAVTASQTFLTLAAESGAADDLATITAGKGTGDFLVLAADAGDTITIKHGTGNISTFEGLDIVLSGSKAVSLIRSGSEWREVGNAANTSTTSSDYIHSGSITGLIGGTGSDLDSISTTDKSVGYRQHVLSPGGTLHTYELQAVSLPNTTITVETVDDYVYLPAAIETLPGQRLRFSTTGTLPAGLSASQIYYVKTSEPDEDRITVSVTKGGAAVDITDTGIGTHTATWIDVPFTVPPVDYHATTNNKMWILVAPGFDLTFEIIGPTTDHAAAYYVMPAVSNHVKLGEVQNFVQSLPSGEGVAAMQWSLYGKQHGGDRVQLHETVDQDETVWKAIDDAAVDWKHGNRFLPAKTALDLRIEATGADAGSGLTDGKGSIITVTGLQSDFLDE